MADKRVTVTIEAVDNASATIGKIQKQIETLAILIMMFVGLIAILHLMN